MYNNCVLYTYILHNINYISNYSYKLGKYTHASFFEQLDFPNHLGSK